MAQYIDKSALVAEIENCINRCNIRKQSCPVNTQIEAICDNKIRAYKEVLSFLNTLEVKEVDLKQSYIEYINNTYNEEFAKSILDDNIKSDLDNSDLFGIMSYGFELGIKASNTLTWEDIEIILGIENNILHECNDNGQLVVEAYPKGEDYYGEILKRFKEREETKS